MIYHTLMTKLNNLFIPLLVLSGLLLLMLFTNPYELHFSLLVLPFLLAGIAIFYTSRLILIDVLGYRRRPSFLAAGTLTFTCVVLLSLSTLRQLTLLDVLLTLCFTLMISWYVKRYFFS